MEYIKRNRLELELLDAPKEERHFHQDIELLYMLEGSAFLTVGHQETHLKKDDIYVVNANKIHSLASEDGTLLVKLSITYRLISDVFVNEPLLFLCNSTVEYSAKYGRLKEGMNVLLRYWMKNKGNTASFRYIALGYNILEILAEDFLVKIPEKKLMSTYDKIDARLDTINNYIRANYSQPLSLKALSAQLYLSEGYLSRFFKKNYGMSFSEYLMNVRLHHAMEDLIYTDIPITKIVYSNGFSNQTVFSRIFKNIYGTTPSMFRRNVRQSGGDKNVQENQTRLWGRAAALLGESDLPERGMKAEASQDSNARQLSLSCEAADNNQNICRFRTVNVGMAEDLLRSELLDHIIELKKSVGMEYVRFCNIFTSGLLIPLGKEAAGMNFSRIDRIFDFLQEQKLKPHIELGIKPRRLMKDLVSAVDGANDFKIQPEETISKADWERSLDALIGHLAKRYKEAIDSWRIELWYDEKLWEDRKTMTGYFDLFTMVYKIVRKYSSSLEVGGSGLKFDYMESHIRSFLSEWKHQEIQPDFISALYYAYERGTAVLDQSFRRSTDPEYLKKCIQKLKNMIEETGMSRCRLYFTEWNFTVSDRNYINDTCFKGAYVIKNLLDAYGNVDDMAYYIGSDCVSEYYDSSELLFGGTGLLSRDGILKPSGHACYFWQLLYPYKVAGNSHVLITTNGKGDYGIVCHNMMELSERYYFLREDAVKKEEIEQYFTQKEELHIYIELKNIRSGQYRKKTYEVNEKNGSVLDLWREMGYEKYLSPEDISYLKLCSGPKMTMERLETRGTSLYFDVKLPANGFAFVALAMEH